MGRTYNISDPNIRLIESVWDWSLYRYWLNDSPWKSHRNLRHWNLTWVMIPCVDFLRLLGSIDVDIGSSTASRYGAVALSSSSNVWRQESSMILNWVWSLLASVFGLDSTALHASCRWSKEKFKPKRMCSNSLSLRGASFRPDVAATKSRWAIWLQSIISPMDRPNDIANESCEEYFFWLGEKGGGL